MLVKRVGVKSQGWVPGSAGFFDMTWKYIARNGNSKVLEQKLGMGLPVIFKPKDFQDCFVVWEEYKAYLFHFIFT